MISFYVSFVVFVKQFFVLNGFDLFQGDTVMTRKYIKSIPKILKETERKETHNVETEADPENVLWSHHLSFDDKRKIQNFEKLLERWRNPSTTPPPFSGPDSDKGSFT